MKLKFSFLLLFLIFGFTKSQNLDSLAELPSSINKDEIRIYKDRGITNSGKIFRIYKIDSVWKAQTIQWFLPIKISSDEFEKTEPIKTNLSSDKNIEEIFMNLEALNIGFLPKEDAFEYKKEKRSVIWDDEEKQYLFQISQSSMLDGYDYSVIYRSGSKKNQFTYNNPQSFLKLFPEIDELKSFVEILNYIEAQFRIEF